MGVAVGVAVGVVGGNWSEPVLMVVSEEDGGGRIGLPASSAFLGGRGGGVAVDVVWDNCDVGVPDLCLIWTDKIHNQVPNR